MISYRAMDTRPRQQIITLIAIALTFASGANDVASFTRLGGVFTSVMTGNIVLWGLSAAQRSVSLFSHTAVSIAGYIIGVAGGTWVAHGFKVRGNGKADETDRDSVLPAHHKSNSVLCVTPFLPWRARSSAMCAPTRSVA